MGELLFQRRCFPRYANRSKLFFMFFNYVRIGNEEDHIIVSVVRSSGPGFLKNERRMNVMLSRCKQSMIICSSKSFLSKGAIKSTLVGKMSEQWADKSATAWISMSQILNATW
jgi:hypothetical protein